MSSTDNPSASKSGIVTDANGQRSIPSSTRADGSKRKEIKIRPGYRPPEDVEVYRNRTADAFRTRGKGAGVPGAQAVKEEKAGTAASNKNAKRREARKRAKTAAGEEANGDDENEDAPGPESTQASGGDAVPANEAAGTQAQAEAEQQKPDPEVEKEKQAKKLKKKLREARDLQQKKARGEGLLPEQLQKAIRINELIRELEKLGFSVEDEAS